MDQKLLELAGLILNCKPEDLLGSSLRMDGRLVVIAPNGMKFIFSPVELENARDSFGLPPVTQTKIMSNAKTRSVASTGSAGGGSAISGKSRRAENRL